MPASCRSSPWAPGATAAPRGRVLIGPFQVSLPPCCNSSGTLKISSGHGLRGAAQSPGQHALDGGNHRRATGYQTKPPIPFRAPTFAQASIKTLLLGAGRPGPAL